MWRRLGRVIDRLFAFPVHVQVRFTAVRLVQVKGNYEREGIVIEILPGQELPCMGETFVCQRVG